MPHLSLPPDAKSRMEMLKKNDETATNEQATPREALPEPGTKGIIRRISESSDE